MTDNIPEDVVAAYDELQNAIEAFVAKVTPAFPMLTDWYMVMASVGPENPKRTYYHYPNSDSPPHHIQGLHDRMSNHLMDLEMESECEDPDHDHG